MQINNVENIKYVLLMLTSKHNIVAYKYFDATSAEKITSHRKDLHDTVKHDLYKLWHPVWRPKALLEIIIREQETFFRILPLLSSIWGHCCLRYREINKVGLG